MNALRLRGDLRERGGWGRRGGCTDDGRSCRDDRGIRIRVDEKMEAGNPLWRPLQAVSIWKRLFYCLVSVNIIIRAVDRNLTHSCTKCHLSHLSSLRSKSRPIRA